MKRLLTTLVLLTGLFPSVPAWAQPAPEVEELFSARATVTEVNLEENFFRAKVEGGLELTFRVDESTQIRAAESGGAGFPPKADPPLAGKPVPTLADLTAGTRVEIQYRYNQDFEKIASQVLVTPSG